MGATKVKPNKFFNFIVNTKWVNCVSKIRNMTLIVDRLEGYDKGNLDVVRLEFAKLKKKLDDCQKDLEDIITPDIGKINRGHNSNAGDTFCFAF